MLGTLLGIGRFSRNALVRGLCYGYVEFFRNIPVLLQLLMWYLVFTESCRRASKRRWHVRPSVFLSKGGLQFPMPGVEPGPWRSRRSACSRVSPASGRWARFARQRREATRPSVPVVAPGLAIVIAVAVLGWLVGGAPPAWTSRRRRRSSSIDGGAVTPEFLAVLLGLTLYTAAFVAEVVRAGIQSVPRGQDRGRRRARADARPGDAAGACCRRRCA